MTIHVFFYENITAKRRDKRKKTLPRIYSVSTGGFNYITTKKMRIFHQLTSEGAGEVTLAALSRACKTPPRA